MIRHNLIPAFGQLRISDLSTHVIRQWMGGLTVSNKRINNILIPLHGILDDAFADGAIDRVRNTAYVQRACVRGLMKFPKTRSGKREVLLLPKAFEALENQNFFTFKKGKQIFHNPVTNKPWSSDVKIRHPLWYNALKAAGVRTATHTKPAIPMRRCCYQLVRTLHGSQNRWDTRI